jgi:hypothetical protein
MCNSNSELAISSSRNGMFAAVPKASLHNKTNIINLNCATCTGSSSSQTGDCNINAVSTLYICFNPTALYCYATSYIYRFLKARLLLLALACLYHLN